MSTTDLDRFLVCQKEAIEDCTMQGLKYLYWYPYQLEIDSTNLVSVCIIQTKYDSWHWYNKGDTNYHVSVWYSAEGNNK